MSALRRMVYAVKIYIAGTHSRIEMITELLGGGGGNLYINGTERKVIMKLFLALPHTITRFPMGVDELLKIFMAGGITGNLKPFWGETCRKMKDGKAFANATEEAMEIFMAGGHINGKYQQVKDYAEIDQYRPYILESFYYCDSDTERLLPYFGDFLLDSGAFTFMQGTGGDTNWDDYVERYADFINRNRVQKYFELDIDSVVGYDRVKEIRKKLEGLTGKPSIPVWHISRGLDEYKRMCDEYDYVAIGGIVSGEIKSTKYGALPSLISEAHKRGAKIHGLGFTALEWLKICHFDSVDSTAWTTGNRFGFIYWFDGKTMQKKNAPKGHRLADSRKVALNNYTEWIKFQKYAEKYL